MNNEKDIIQDEEIDLKDNKATKAFLDFMRSLPKKENATYIINSERVKDFKYAYALMRKVAGNDSGVTIGVNKLEVKSIELPTGIITLEGKDFIFSNTKDFAKVLSLANMIDVYPLANVGIRATIEFKDIFVEVKD
jgi:hypothetical protein